MGRSGNVWASAGRAASAESMAVKKIHDLMRNLLVYLLAKARHGLASRKFFTSCSLLLYAQPLRSAVSWLQDIFRHE